MMSNNISESAFISQLARKEEITRSINARKFNLKHVTAMNDRSLPRLDMGFTLKRSAERVALMNSICGAIPLRVLKATQINDRSSPKIDATLKIRPVQRSMFLDNVLGGAHSFYSRLLGKAGSLASNAASGVASFASATANTLLNAAQAKANELVEVGKATVNNAEIKAAQALEAGKEIAADTAYAAQAKAGQALQAGMVKASELSNMAQVKAGQALEAGKEIAADTANAAQAKASQLSSAAQNKAASMYDAGMESLRMNAHTQLLADIQANRQRLNHVSPVSMTDRSKPFLPSSYALPARYKAMRHSDLRSRLMNEVQMRAASVPLKHVLLIHDCSIPLLPAHVNLNKNDRKALLEQVSQGQAALTAAPVTADRSAPALPQQFELKVHSRSALLGDVQKGIELQQNMLVRDRSAPQIPQM